MKKVIAGTKQLSKNSNLCNHVKHGFIRTETKKAEYDHIFHELISQEQALEIFELNQKLNLYDCNTHSGRVEIFKLWVTYDEKWYAKIRSKKEEHNKRLEKKWEAGITPNDDDNWDGVINGIYLSIPRNYIWIGSRKPDGYQQSMNLQFFYPDMGSSPSKTFKALGPTNIGGLLTDEYRITHPCFGFEGQKTCTKKSYQVPFTTKYLDCNSYQRYKRDGDTPYHGIWQRQCDFMESGTLDLQPIFDTEAQMWRIGEAGYYKGDPEFPDEWYICKKPQNSADGKTLGKRICDSSLLLGHGIVFHYTYPRHLFKEQRKIQELLKKRIESFIIKDTNERKVL